MFFVILLHFLSYIGVISGEEYAKISQISFKYQKKCQNMKKTTWDVKVSKTGCFYFWKNPHTSRLHRGWGSPKGPNGPKWPVYFSTLRTQLLVPHPKNKNITMFYQNHISHQMTFPASIFHTNRFPRIPTADPRLFLTIKWCRFWYKYWETFDSP